MGIFYNFIRGPIISKTALILTAAVILLSTIVLKAQEKWEFHSKSNGISIYTAARHDSEFDAVKATFTVEATLEEYAAVVLDVEEYKHWNYATTNPYVIQRISDTELIYYSEVDSPWPVMDRFVILYLTVEIDETRQKLVVTLKNVPELMPEKEGFVRIPELYSVLEVVQVAPGKLKAEYILKTEPGGSIPAWAINFVSTRIPITTFSNIKERLKTLQHRRAMNNSGTH